VLHRKECWQLVRRQSEQNKEDFARERNRECLCKVYFRAVDELVDKAVGRCDDRPLARLDFFGREQRVKDLSKLRVLRRIDLQRDERALILEVVSVRGRAEQTGAAKNLVDQWPRA